MNNICERRRLAIEFGRPGRLAATARTPGNRASQKWAVRVESFAGGDPEAD